MEVTGASHRPPGEYLWSGWLVKDTGTRRGRAQRKKLYCILGGDGSDALVLSQYVDMSMERLVCETRLTKPEDILHVSGTNIIWPT